MPVFVFGTNPNLRQCALPWLENTCMVLTVVTMHLYMFENDVSHNLQFKMAAPSWYFSVHDGRHNVLGMYTDCPRMDYTCNMKGSLGEALRYTIKHPIKFYIHNYFSLVINLKYYT